MAQVIAQIIHENILGCCEWFLTKLNMKAGMSKLYSTVINIVSSDTRNFRRQRTGRCRGNTITLA